MTASKQAVNEKWMRMVMLAINACSDNCKALSLHVYLDVTAAAALIVEPFIAACRLNYRLSGQNAPRNGRYALKCTIARCFFGYIHLPFTIF
ncbi:hypothetical protein [Pseudomonas shirazensis]